MTQFLYKAKRQDHQRLAGTIQAETQEQALKKILQQGLFVFDLREEKRKQENSQRRKKDNPHFPAKVSPKDLAHCIRQLSDLMDSGVDILSAIDLLRTQSQSVFLKNIFGEVYLFIKDGGDFSEALHQHPEVFPSLYANLMRSGELSGRLPEILGRIADLMQKNDELKSKIRSSLIYPLFILGFGFLTIFVLLTSVIPRLAEMFEEMNQALPWLTQGLIAVSRFCVRFGGLFLSVTGLALWGLHRWRKNSFDGRLWLDGLVLKIPSLGSFVKHVELGRLTRTLATLLESGIVIDQALRSAEELLENQALKQEFRRVVDNVVDGSSLTQALTNSGYFSESVRCVIAVSEASGQLARGLSRLADTYQRDADNLSKTLIALLEPVMILVVGLFVGLIVLALVLPIFQMNLLMK